MSGTPIILGSDGSTAVIGTSSEPLLTLPPNGPTPTQPPSPTTGPVYPPCYVSQSCTVDGVTIDGYTTIPSPTRHSGSRPTSGSAAFHALQPFGAIALNSLNAALSGFAGLGSSPSAQSLASLADTFATAFAGKSYPVSLHRHPRCSPSHDRMGWTKLTGIRSFQLGRRLKFSPGTRWWW